MKKILEDILKPELAIYKYTLKSKISSGCFSEVWLAQDNSIDTEIALKVMPSENVMINEKLRETRIGYTLKHSNLSKIHYADIISHTKEDGNKINLILIAMDFYKKGAITEYLNSQNYINLKILLPKIIDILRGLEYLHENKIYHNDIKPKNILINDIGCCVLTDYGISVCCKSSQYTKSPNSYIYHTAPENIDSSFNYINTVNEQSDIYQLGLTFYRLANGISTISNEFKHLSTPQECFELIKNKNLNLDKKHQYFIPNCIKNVINKAISKDLSKRYKTALDMRRDLEKITLAGYWTSNEKGDFEGFNNNETYKYNYEIEKNKNNEYSFIAYQTNLSSGRKTKISEFSNKKLKKSELTKLHKKFIDNVVTG